MGSITQKQVQFPEALRGVELRSQAALKGWKSALGEVEKAPYPSGSHYSVYI